MKKPSKLLVAGASGALGRKVCLVATEQGFSVRALGRQRSKLEALGVDEAVVADALDPSSLGGVMEGVSHVFSALGASVAADFKAGSKTYDRVDTPANCNLIDAAARAGVEKFVYVSVASQDALGETAYVRAHEAVVNHLRASGLANAIVRPTGFFSAFAPFLEMAKKGVVPSMGDPNARTNPIDDLDLARFAVRALREDIEDGAVGGPEVLTRQEILEAAFRALDKPAKIRPLPSWAVKVMSSLMRPFNARMADISRFYLAASSTDCIAPSHGHRKIGDFFVDAVAGRADAVAGSRTPAQ